MPSKDFKQIQSLIQQLTKRATKLQKQFNFQKAAEVYQKILSLCPQFEAQYIKYSKVLIKLKQYEKCYRILEYTIKMNPKDISLYNNYVEILFEIQNFEKIKEIIKRGQKYDDNDLNLYIRYAKACYGSKTFTDGLDMIDSYEKKYPQTIASNEKVLVWRVYLFYQVGNYQEAYKYLKKVVQFPQIESDDLEQYQVQISKFCLLLEYYNECLIWTGKVIINEQTKQMHVLKVYALRAYAFYKISKIQQSQQAMEYALKIDCNNEMIQIKWSLLNIMYVSKDNLKNLEDMIIKQRIVYVLIKMLDTTQQNFEESPFKEHFNWFVELNGFSHKLQFLYQNFDLIPENLSKFQEYASILFLSLLQGYEHCIKTYDKLKDIEKDILGQKMQEVMKQTEGMKK